MHPSSFIQNHLNSILGALIMLCFLLGIISTSSIFSPVEILPFFSADKFSAEKETAIRLVLYEIRLPRLILTFLIGFVSGMIGAVLQGYFKNPLADPGVLGLSSGAVLGAVIAFYFSATGFAILGISDHFIEKLNLVLISIPLMALIGTAITSCILLCITCNIQSPGLVILTGIALSGLATALTALVLSLSPNPWALSEIMNWMMGSTDKASWNDVFLVLPFMIAGLLFLRPVLPALDHLTLGEETAQTLGTNLIKTQFLIIIGSALAIGASVATTGQIGFIGLVSPHLIRPVMGYQPSKIVLPSALTGAFLLLLSDIIIHLFQTGRPSLPLGVVTALIGTPFFFFLIYKLKRKLR